jgi:hypothetical protein
MLLTRINMTGTRDYIPTRKSRGTRLAIRAMESKSTRASTTDVVIISHKMVVNYGAGLFLVQSILRVCEQTVGNAD